MKRFWLLLFISLLINSCEQSSETSIDLLNDVAPNLEGDWINIVVEIPTGSNEKWEVNKKSGKIERDSLNGQPRTINYLGYPGNYGFIPQTLLPKELGGDGDPLDVLVIGTAVERGTILRCKVIGVLQLLDNGEQDDKLIAISEESLLSGVESIEELNQSYAGILEILETWFNNYKGPDEMLSKGFGSREMALEIINTSLDAYRHYK